MEPAATFQVWASDSPPPTSSLPAQVAAKTINRFQPSASFAFHRALLEAYFTDNRDISDGEVLAAVARECGVDPVDFRAAVADNNQEMTQAVINDHNSAIEQGINAVPSVLINNAMAVPGAQDVDTYATWIERILSLG
jgi:predicted DsbA family dithiol-disulfide isomerase